MHERVEQPCHRVRFGRKRRGEASSGEGHVIRACESSFDKGFVMTDDQLDSSSNVHCDKLLLTGSLEQLAALDGDITVLLGDLDDPVREARIGFGADDIDRSVRTLLDERRHVLQ